MGVGQTRAIDMMKMQRKRQKIRPLRTTRLAARCGQFVPLAIEDGGESEPAAIVRTVLRGPLGSLQTSQHTAADNVAMIIAAGSGSHEPLVTIIRRRPWLRLSGRSHAYAVPFYLYDADGANRRENVTDWGVDRFQSHYKEPVISKWSIFDYVYGLLHHPGYRARYERELASEPPRVPFAADFRAFQRAGQSLAELHLNVERLEPWPLEFVYKPGTTPSYRVAGRMRLSRDKTHVIVNDSLTLAGIPPEPFLHRLGARSAVESLIEQDASELDRPDDEQYVVRLVGQVVRLSVETMRIVNGLPAEFDDGAAKPRRSGS
jgi:predicted helicase